MAPLAITRNDEPPVALLDGARDFQRHHREQIPA
jgi:PHD/YefM family antitoxin component YafN of YafNO toxin-antitoxin module